MKISHVLVISAFLLPFWACYKHPTMDSRPIAQLDPEQERVSRAILSCVLEDLKNEYNVSAWSAVYIELPGKTDPPIQWLEEHSDYPAQLLPASMCILGGDFNEVNNRKSGKGNGLLVTIGDGTTQEDQSIAASYCWHDNSLAGRCYEILLKKVSDKWVVIKRTTTLMSMAHLTKPFSGRGVAACQARGDVLFPRPWPASADGRR